MKPEEALKNIGDWISEETEQRKYDKATVIELADSLITLKVAVNKQVPKKPIIFGKNTDGPYRFKCPECGRLWWEKSYITKYCDKCGNLIDRSEIDE